MKGIPHFLVNYVIQYTSLRPKSKRFVRDRSLSNHKKAAKEQGFFFT
jgi:hypothetical protein